MKRAAIYNLTWDALGGGERYTAAFAKLLEEKGCYDIEIWWPKDIQKDIKSRFDIDLQTTRFCDNPLRNKSVWQKLAMTAKYDLIFWVSNGSVSLSFAKKNLVHFQIPFASSSLANKFKARMVTAICNSKFTKNIIDSTYGINSQVIYPPVDTELFRPGTKEHLIVAIGRLSRELHAKRQDVLVEAFAELHKNLPGWKLVIAGGSQDIDYYKGLLDQARGLPIKIIANPSLHQIKDLFAKAKIFWSATGYKVDVSQTPEKVEHFGITLVEAMSAGVVPIVTAAGGHTETVLHGKTGFLWENVDELITFTAEMAKNYRKWGIFSKKSQARSKIFSIEKFNADWGRFI